MLILLRYTFSFEIRRNFFKQFRNVYSKVTGRKKFQNLGDVRAFEILIDNSEVKMLAGIPDIILPILSKFSVYLFQVL